MLGTYFPSLLTMSKAGVEAWEGGTLAQIPGPSSPGPDPAEGLVGGRASVGLKRSPFSMVHFLGEKKSFSIQLI